MILRGNLENYLTEIQMIIETEATKNHIIRSLKTYAPIRLK
jgi:hypothetical protein